MKAKEHRSRARTSLIGMWGLALITTLVASLLGGFGNGISAGSVDVSLNELANESAGASGLYAPIRGAINSLSDEAEVLILSLIGVLSILLFVCAVVTIVFGGATKAGLCRFNQNLYHKTETKFTNLFAHYNRFGTLLGANILVGLFIFLWTLLFIIPGIIASYAYSMTFYILDEHPEMSAMDAIKASKRMMEGHKWELFCLQLSFIGWMVLSCFTAGIGFLFLDPYMKAAECSFYNELKYSVKVIPECTEDASEALAEPSEDDLHEEA